MIVKLSGDRSPVAVLDRKPSEEGFQVPERVHDPPCDMVPVNLRSLAKARIAFEVNADQVAPYPLLLDVYSGDDEW